MASQDQIAEFVQRRIAVGRVQPAQTYWYPAHYPVLQHGGSLPTVEQMAAELVQDAEFRALQLGRLLNTPTGEIVESAVAYAVPRAFAPEFGLIVGALRLAADFQKSQSRDRAILAAGGTLLVGVCFQGLRRAA